eukprot:5300955-Pyramimonas_sp.AAC.1
MGRGAPCEAANWRHVWNSFWGMIRATGVATWAGGGAVRTMSLGFQVAPLAGAIHAMALRRNGPRALREGRRRHQDGLRGPP